MVPAFYRGGRFSLLTFRYCLLNFETSGGTRFFRKGDFPPLVRSCLASGIETRRVFRKRESRTVGTSSLLFGFLVGRGLAG